MVVQNDIMNAASKQYSMNYVTKNDITKEYSVENNAEVTTEATSDVAASVSLSKKVDKDMTAYTGVIDNAQEDITKNQVADMSLAEMNQKLYKITQLSIQAGYEGKSYEDKKEIQDEIKKLRLEIQDIGLNTTFGGKNVFLGSPEDENADKTLNNVNAIDSSSEMNDKIEKTSEANNVGIFNDNKNVPKISIDFKSMLETIEEIDVTRAGGSTDALVKTNKAMDYIDDARKYIHTEQARLVQLIQGAVGEM